MGRSKSEMLEETQRQAFPSCNTCTDWQAEMVITIGSSSCMQRIDSIFMSQVAIGTEQRYRTTAGCCFIWWRSAHGKSKPPEKYFCHP